MTVSFRGSPGIVFGDVIGANVAVCLVALGVGALIAPLPFPPRVRRYAVARLPLGVLAGGPAWDGEVTRLGGWRCVAAYVVFVAVIWVAERRPPALGTTGEPRKLSNEPPGRVGWTQASSSPASWRWRWGGRCWSRGCDGSPGGGDADHARLTLVGPATAFEPSCSHRSSARTRHQRSRRRRLVGSFAYNVTMTLGAGAIVRPLVVTDLRSRPPAVVLMLGAIGSGAAPSVPGWITRPVASSCGCLPDLPGRRRHG